MRGNSSVRALLFFMGVQHLHALNYMHIYLYISLYVSPSAPNSRKISSLSTFFISKYALPYGVVRPRRFVKHIKQVQVVLNDQA